MPLKRSYGYLPPSWLRGENCYGEDEKDSPGGKRGRPKNKKVFSTPHEGFGGTAIQP